MRVIVAGGGIGGLATALALRKEGIAVDVYEKAAEREEIGAGLQISANATKALRHLGLGERLDEVGVAAEGIEMRDLATNRLLHKAPLGEPAAKRYGAPFYQVHRGDLQRILAEALPDDVLQLNEACVGFADEAGGVTVELSSGKTAHGDALVGADGIHSTVRRQLLGEQELEFANIVAWRSLIPSERIAHLGLAPKCYCWWAPGRSAVVYYVRSMKLFNFVGIVPSLEARPESWTELGDVGAVRRSYEGSNEVLQSIVDEIDETFITGYYFRDPLPRWSFGRATILGDSAHPMHPFLAQGACQAVEDAVELAAVLGRRGPEDVPAALEEYEVRRRPRTSEIQTVSKDTERMWHMADPKDMRERNGQLRALSRIDPLATTVWGWLHGYDPVAEARQPLRQPEMEVMRREESRRAWRMWDTMLTPEDIGKGIPGVREAYDVFLLTNFPAVARAPLGRGNADGLPTVEAKVSEEGPILIHFHGGGYIVGSAEASVGLISRLAEAVAGRCVAPEYRLAPEFPFPAAVDDGVKAFRWLVEQGIDPNRIVLVGESSGGGLAVATCMALRDEGLPLPAGVVAISPFADMTVSGSSIDERAGDDPICTRKQLTQMAVSYLQYHDPEDPLASPVFANLRDFPPMLVQVGGNEALFDDSRRLVEAAQRADVDVRLETFDDTVHVFPIFDFLPEAAEALRQIDVFTAEVTGGSAR